ncbi:MAG: hypothetical protein EAZ52_06690 [Alphaproteobacteria bacterium]|nr:MAG: hypothetical protein EAZ52_06690 [Alphaproteobacteria bacterium]
MISLQQSFSAQTLNNHLRRTSISLHNNIQQLSSGSRVGHTHHVESIYHISSRFRVHENDLRYEAKNMAAASSLLSVANDGLTAIEEMINRMQSLAQTAQNSTLTQAERDYLMLEFQTLNDEIDRIALNTTFGNVHLLNGGVSSDEWNLGGRGFVLNGDQTAEQLRGTEGSDTIIGSGGNDVLHGMGGGDVFDVESGESGLQGIIYRPYADPSMSIGDLTTAEEVISSKMGSFVFRATNLDYMHNMWGGDVVDFLGADAASLNNSTTSNTLFDNLVMVFRGSLVVQTTGSYDFDVASDDGFALDIGGVRQIDHGWGRSFDPLNPTETPSPIHLTAGVHDFQLIYFEGFGNQGLRVRSNLAGGGMQVMDSNHFIMPGGTNDGNDTLIGGADDFDIAQFRGNRADYAITQRSEGEFLISDMRVGTPNGSDTLRHIDMVRFADGDYYLTSENRPKTLDFFGDNTASDPISYEILNVRSHRLFERTPTMSLASAQQASDAQTTLTQAEERVAFLRNYVNNLHAKSEMRYEESMRTMHSMEQIDSSLFDTDFAKTSSEYTQELMKTNSNVLMRVQTHNMQQNMLRLIND